MDSKLIHISNYSFKILLKNLEIQADTYNFDLTVCGIHLSNIKNDNLALVNGDNLVDTHVKEIKITCPDCIQAFKRKGL